MNEEAELRIMQLRMMPYQEYLKTPEWQSRREEALERDGYCCRVCNASEKLEVHHRTYIRRGHEDLNDLTTLCEECHELFHGQITRLLGISREMATLMAQENEGMVDDRAEQQMFERDQWTNGRGGEASLKQLLTRYAAKLDLLAAHQGQLVGVPSGFADLDRLTGGFRKSDLIVLAARPAIGKTGCALSMAYQAALWYQQRIGIFSLEMNQEQVVERLVSMETGINLQRLNTGNVEEDEWEKIVLALGRLSEANIRVDGTSVLSPGQMRSRARRWVQEEGIDLIIVDYMQLMQPSDDGRRKQESRVQVIDEISRNLKLLARELNIPILVLAQLSRAVEIRASKVPQLSDLRESGGIENNADIVIFIYRDEVYNPETERRGIADLIVAKHRNGPTGQIALAFEPQTTRFRDLGVAQMFRSELAFTREEDEDEDMVVAEDGQELLGQSFSPLEQDEDMR